MSKRVTISDSGGNKTTYIRQRPDCVVGFSRSPQLCDNSYKSKSGLPVASKSLGVKINGEMTIIILRLSSLAMFCFLGRVPFSRIARPAFEMKGPCY